jgi:hypothetical protein
MPISICTIIARNYQPAARALAVSFLEHHPDGRVSTLLIDDLYGEVDAALEPFEVLGPVDVGVGAEEFHRMAMIYDVLELATAIKLRPGHSGSPPDSGPSTGATQTDETDGVPPPPSLKVTT